MGLTGNIVHPYPATLTDAQWKAAKTAATGDKLKTEVGATLRAAQVAYDKIKFTQLSLQQLELVKPKLTILNDVTAAKTGAAQHYKITVKPAIKALEAAKSKADLARINPIITGSARTKATQISQDLGHLITTLKSFNTADYDYRLKNLNDAYKIGQASFNNALKKAMSGARTFITTARATPTVATYNAGIQTAARDLTQCLGQVDRMQKSGFQVGQNGAWANTLFDQLTPRAQGHADLPAKAKPAAVLAAIKQFEDLVDDVDEWRA